jgi:hypothetical protein
MRRRSWVVLLLACLCGAAAACCVVGGDGVALDLLRGFVPGLEWGVRRAN